MVLDVQPVADLLAVAIHRQGFAGQGVHDHQRDQLFGEVQGAVVVGAIGGEHRQPVGVVVGAHQVVAGRLGRRIRAVRLVAVGFSKGRIGLGERPIHLVGRHMQQAEIAFPCICQAAPVGPHRFQQMEGPDDVGLDEFAWPVDRAVHVRFGCEVHHRARLVLCQQLADQGRITKVALDEHMARVAGQRCQILQIAGVGEFVEVDNRFVGAGQPVQYKVAAYEAGAAGDENGHGNGVLGNGRSPIVAHKNGDSGG